LGGESEQLADEANLTGRIPFVPTFDAWNAPCIGTDSTHVFNPCLQPMSPLENTDAAFASDTPFPRR
jgi:hypothetical protein